MKTRQNSMLAMIAGTLLLVGCGDQKPEGVIAASPTLPLASTTAETLRANPSNADEPLLVSGPLIVEHQVDLTAQRDGVVEKILLDAPARVKEGTILAVLDDRQIAANLEAARAKTRSIADDLKNWESEAEVLKADYVRAQKMWEMGLTSEEQLQHAQYKAESDQWDIKRVSEMLNTAHQEERSLELELEKTKITAPFDGVIARRYVREGQSLAKGDRMFWVTAERPLRLRFTLPERYLGHLKTGQVFPLSSPDVQLEKHEVKIIEISPVVDPSSGTIEILTEVMGPAGNLRPGMTTSVLIDHSR